MEIIPSVKEMLDSVNNTMTAFGFSDTKLKSFSKTTLGTISTNRELLDTEKDTIIFTMQNQLAKSQLLNKLKIVELKLS